MPFFPTRPQWSHVNGLKSSAMMRVFAPQKSAKATISAWFFFLPRERKLLTHLSPYHWHSQNHDWSQLIMEIPSCTFPELIKGRACDPFLSMGSGFLGFASEIKRCSISLPLNIAFLKCGTCSQFAIKGGKLKYEKEAYNE